MQIYKAVVIVFLCEIDIVLSNGEEWQLPLSIEEESNGELHRPHELNTNQVLHKHENTYGFVELGYRYRADRERQQVIDFTRSGINIHPQFSGGSLNNIATIRLKHPVTLNRYVHPIRLPRLSDTRTFEMMEGTAPGRQYNGTMRYLRNQIMSNDDCLMNTQFICTNAYIGGAFCNRMYGAGLVVEDENGPILIGLTNLIYSCSLNNSILYMRLSLLRDWIANSSNYVFDF
ncbi:trypsin-1-like [Anopheles arabiensis]|uniref:trypsin-1-like n=1 Tax=Anopheles arabiensis TaxID=7173 RepID=UPI001AAD98FB|nr:trypsin-1-like [Anopheles arabiensis]